MSVRRKIYALSLAAIYMAAMMLSSLSILLCQHEHHDHHHVHHVEHCDTPCCASDSHVVLLADGCCDHDHPMLGEHHTEFITSEKRNNVQNDIAQLFVHLCLAADGVLDAVSQPSIAPQTIRRGDKSEPPQAAYTPHRSLRAPPALA